MSLNPIRVGLVGAGVMSSTHLPFLLSLGAEVFVFSEEGASELVAKFGGTVVDSFEALLERVDYVDVATPTYTHFALVKRALEAGKDVISEKPLARSSEEASQLLELAAGSGRKLFVGHVVRFFPEYVQLKKSVESGRLGELAVLRFSRSGAFPTRSPWFADRRLSGGIIMDQMIHDLDMARWIAGEVVRVSAVSSQAGDAEHPVHAAHVLLTHGSGAISHVAGIWGPAHLQFATEYSVTGTLGKLEHSSAAQQNYVTDLAVREGGGELVPETDPAENPYFLELQEFVEAFRGGPEPRVTAEDAAAAVRIAVAALESLDSGQPVDPTFTEGSRS